MFVRGFRRPGADQLAGWRVPVRGGCGQDAVAGLNEALWARACAAKLLRTARVRAETTVVAAKLAYPTDPGLLAKAVGKLVRAARRVQARERQKALCPGGVGQGLSALQPQVTRLAAMSHLYRKI